MVKKYIALFAAVFIFAFVVNIAWEFTHAQMYIHYKGSEITNFLLLRAALFDASFITMLSLLVFFNKFLRKRAWIGLTLAVIFAIGLERFALLTDRWAYNDLMPIIPLLETGLTPTIQLGIVWIIIYMFLFHYILPKKLSI